MIMFLTDTKKLTTSSIFKRTTNENIRLAEMFTYALVYNPNEFEGVSIYTK